MMDVIHFYDDCNEPLQKKRIPVSPRFDGLKPLKILSESIGCISCFNVVHSYINIFIYIYV